MKKTITLALLFLSLIYVNADEERSTKVVHELLKTMNKSEQYKKNVERIMDMQTKQNPTMTPILKNTMFEFFNKYMGWDRVKDDLAKIYMKNFTDNELKELIAFYKTPIGQKAASLLTASDIKVDQMWQLRVQKNMPELQQKMQESMKKAQEQKDGIETKIEIRESEK